MAGLTHFDEAGRPRMVDVGDKPVSRREAVARGVVRMRAETLGQIVAGRVEKGDVLRVAEVAGIMAAKRAGELVPMCHPLGLSAVEVAVQPDPDLPGVQIQAVVRTEARTGVEMEALTAVAVAALTVYDMCKAIDRDMVIGDIRLVEKSGGKSGPYRRAGDGRLGLEPQAPVPGTDDGVTD